MIEIEKQIHGTSLKNVWFAEKPIDTSGIINYKEAVFVISNGTEFLTLISDLTENEEDIKAHFSKSGKPLKTTYHPNIMKKVDTSGVLILDYGKFKANLVIGKDCKSPAYATIQGDKGYIRFNSTTSRCSSFDLVMNDGKTKSFKDEDGEFVGWKTMYGEFIKLYKNKDYETCYKYLQSTLTVQKVLDEARASAKMVF